MSKAYGLDMARVTCRHCGWEFYQLVDYPKKCRECQKKWPLGEPPTVLDADHAPGYTTEQLRRWTETKAEKKTAAQA